MNTAIGKAIKVGRATMLAIGVGVSLALVLGFATVVLAAVPGDPFRLGKVNIINNATTTLRSGLDGGSVLQLQRTSGIGPVLDIENNQTPGFAQRGIDITVPKGQPPISVSGPDSATASGLSADRLDGRDQQEFLSASRIYRVGTPQPVQGQDGNGDSVLLTAGLVCDEGDVAIGGGGNAVDIEDDLNAVIPASDSSYQIEFQDNDSPSKFAGFVLCSDSSKPFK